MELTFDLLETGSRGHLEVTETVNSCNQIWTFPSVTLPVDIPPVLTSLREQVQGHIDDPSRIPIHVASTFNLVPRELAFERLLYLEPCLPHTTLNARRHPISGEVRDFVEQELVLNSGGPQHSGDPHHSGAPQQTRTSSVIVPGSEYLFIPPGFDHGLQIVDVPDGLEIDVQPDVPDLSNISRNLRHFTTQRESCPPSQSGNQILSTHVQMLTGETDLDELLQDDRLEQADDPAPDPTLTTDEQRTRDETADTTHRSGGRPVERLPSRPEQWAFSVDVSESVHEFHDRIPDMAFKWPFELDTFQKQAILRLESNESVFVAAHTSAGKTVIAEYAIALSMRHMTRTMYTSPVKALSNQKYRELKMTFDDVGLMTGDIQINETASCLIVTTEILRTMLYEGSDMIRELEWVIIDEVHYINDTDRGVVWEEVLIMLPDSVKIVMLSATVPNTMELAEWVGRIKRKQVFVITTPERPVPLQHFLYTGVTTARVPNGLFLFIDEESRFIEQGYDKARDTLKGKDAVSYKTQDRKIWKSVIDMMQKENRLPAVAFIFSKKKIDVICKYGKDLCLTSHSEQHQIQMFVDKCVAKLHAKDRELPQVHKLTGLLHRGFGVHHSGILPIFKEMIEILFQRGLIKVLLATETFAMGVNMPAKTVVFDSVIKHDGKAFRPVHPGEYTQMAGRAGRRGHDTTGTVIVLCNGEVPDVGQLHRMALGKPTPLESRFRLTYSMILQLMRVEQLKVHDMMKRSFSEFHTKKTVAKSLEHVKTQLEDVREIHCFLCNIDLAQYHSDCVEYYRLQEYMQSVILSHPRGVQDMHSGRILMVRRPQNQVSLGVLLATYVTDENEKMFKTFVLTDRLQQPDTGEMGVHPVEQIHLLGPKNPWFEVVNLSTKYVLGISRIVHNVDTQFLLEGLDGKLRNKKKLSGVVVDLIKDLHALSLKHPSGLSGYDPSKDLNICDTEVIEKWRAIKFLFDSLTQTYDCRRCPDFREHFYAHDRNVSIRQQHKELQYLASDDYLALLPEYHQRVQVLKGLKYISEDDLVQLKGRVACLMMQHEVLITEVIMENLLTDLDPPEIAALLSCFVLETSRCKQPYLKGALQIGKQRILEIVEKVGSAQVEAGMKIPVDFLKKQMHFGLTQVVHEWALGKAFSEVTQLTDVQEGVIVKCIQTLHDVLARVKAAGELIGNQTLVVKCQAAMTSIRRDIVFATSLYLQ
ncbi:unnamed protein product [Lymnaea stagnalis]|uniref:Helicase SKI2W n=1 Tax=Lymnaea stagnalis TaxID=6523 RepID=A0AAV2HW88_LYMST